MSSASIQIGFPEDNAPKKVVNLRGRAHTDIFGTGEQAQPTPKKQQSASNIQNILTEETDGVKEPKENTTQKDNKTDYVNGNVPQPVATPQRVRMPPGGHSSGLW